MMATTTPQMPRIGTHAHRALAELAHRGAVGMTSPEYQAVAGSWRLAAAVMVLRRAGWHIVSQWVKHPNRRFTRYVLVEGM